MIDILLVFLEVGSTTSVDAAYTKSEFENQKVEDPKYFFQKQQFEEKHKGEIYIYQIQQLDLEKFVLVFKSGAGKPLVLLEQPQPKISTSISMNIHYLNNLNVINSTSRDIFESIQSPGLTKLMLFYFWHRGPGSIALYCLVLVMLMWLHKSIIIWFSLFLLWVSLLWLVSKNTKDSKA